MTSTAEQNDLIILTAEHGDALTLVTLTAEHNDVLTLTAELDDVLKFPEFTTIQLGSQPHGHSQKHESNQKEPAYKVTIGYHHNEVSTNEVTKRLSINSRKEQAAK